MTAQAHSVKEVLALLPQSEVFPKHIKTMLARNISGLTPKALDLLFEILREEKRRLEEVR